MPLTKQTPHRQIVLDTETTGINPKDGHKIIEIGCVEMVNRRLTHQRFHHYLNPEREIEAEAIAVHGISNDMLQDKPKFRDIADKFLEFVAGAELIIHNAPFDVGFINHELSLLPGPARKLEQHCKIHDTLAQARRLHPGARNSLDALCKRYAVDNSKRELHGALLDAEILADVYLKMTGGQISLLEDQTADPQADQSGIQRLTPIRSAAGKIISCNEEEIQAHQQYLQLLDKASGGKCLWPKGDSLNTG